MLIKPDDYSTLWAVMIAGTAAAIWLEQTYKWAAKLSGPVVALLLAMLLSNSGIMPPESPAYDFVGTWLVPLAIPLLLFRANLVEILRETGSTFVCFHLSAVGTLLGTGIAFVLLRGRIASPDIEYASGIMAGSYIGGGVNFFAVAESFNAAGNVTSPLIVADNFVMAGVFILLLTIAGSRFFRRLFLNASSNSGITGEGENLARRHWRRKEIALLDIAKALAFAFVVVGLGNLLVRAARAGFGDAAQPSLFMQMVQTLCTNKFVMITGISLLLATLVARPLRTVNGPEEIGSFLLYLFLFVIGLPADLKAVLVKAPLFFVFCAVIALTNLTFTLTVGKLLRLPLEELLLSINAALGGAPSAAAMAISCGWPRLVLPAILVGIWGYVIGTPCGVLIVEFLRGGGGIGGVIQ